MGLAGRTPRAEKVCAFSSKEPATGARRLLFVPSVSVSQYLGICARPRQWRIWPVKAQSKDLQGRFEGLYRTITILPI
jgi:hypothetical protein